MANTTKANVLLIAPELSTYISNVAQVYRISVNTVSNAQLYSITINSRTASYTSDATATAVEIVAGLISAIEANSILNAFVSCLNALDGTFTITAKTAGTAYTISVSSKLTATSLTANYNGDGLFNLILKDVEEEITTYTVNTETQEKAQRYLMAHLLTVHYSGIQGNVKSESVGRASVTYMGGDMFDPDMLSRTRYGAEFWRIWKRNRSLQGL